MCSAFVLQLSTGKLEGIVTWKHLYMSHEKRTLVTGGMTGWATGEWMKLTTELLSYLPPGISINHRNI